MKALILSLLLFFTVNAQNNYYVSNATSGNGSGSSWANARGYLLVNWGNITPGTTVYFDGGTDSVVYDCNNYDIGTRGTVALPIVITNGIDAGHNGKVVFRNTSTGAGGDSGMNLANVINTIFYNLEWKGGLTLRNPEIWLLNFGGDSNVQNVTFSYCTFINNYSCGIGTNEDGTSNNIKFLHCNHYSPLDNGARNSSDMMWLGGANHKNWEIAYCNFINANPKTGATGSDAHRDLIQCEAGWGQGGTFKIHHNFFDDRSGGMGGAIIESEHLRGNWEIYNNIFKSNSTGGAAWGQSYFMGTLSLTGQGNTYANSLKVYNNTIIAMTDMVRCPFFAGWDALDFRNNIFYSYDADADWGACVTDGWTQQHSMTFTNNQYYSIGSGSSFMVGEDVIGSGAQNFTFAQWQSAGYGVGSNWNTDTPDFIDIDGLDGTDYALTLGSDGIDDGTTIALVVDDYSGVPRPQGSAYDKGAFEYIDNSSNNINVKAKLFLQGPFDTNAMTTILNQSSQLPNSQPYNSAPWNYNGNENLGSGPNSSMVDWVLVELRNTSIPTQIVARRAAMLKNNGRLLDTDGVNAVTFSNVDAGSYYIVVYHRDHLAIMSAAPVPLSSNSDLYDFTTAMNKAYGQNPMVELAPGLYGMYAGDGNADGVVNIADRDDVWLVQNGNMGYLEGDFNMNSGVTIHDVNQLWNLNNGAMTRVP